MFIKRPTQVKYHKNLKDFLPFRKCFVINKNILKIFDVKRNFTMSNFGAASTVPADGLAP